METFHLKTNFKFRVVLILFISLSLEFSGLFPSQANAKTSISECIEFQNPLATVSETNLKLSVDIIITCTKDQLGKAFGQKPIYSMPQEDALLNPDSCSGPSLTSSNSMGPSSIGKAICYLRIGNTNLASLRIGATSTKLKIWIPWDSSSKEIEINHVSIPGPSKIGNDGIQVTNSSNSSEASGQSLDYAYSLALAAAAAADSATASAQDALEAVKKLEAIVREVVPVINQACEELRNLLSTLKNRS